MTPNAPWTFPAPNHPDASKAIIEVFEREARALGLEPPRRETSSSVTIYGLRNMVMAFPLITISTKKIVAWPPDVVCDVAVYRHNVVQSNLQMLHYLFTSNGSVRICEDLGLDGFSKPLEPIDGWAMGTYAALRGLFQALQDMAAFINEAARKASKREGQLEVTARGMIVEHVMSTKDAPM